MGHRKGVGTEVLFHSEILWQLDRSRKQSSRYPIERILILRRLAGKAVRAGEGEDGWGGAVAEWHAGSSWRACVLLESVRQAGGGSARSCRTRKYARFLRR